MKALYLEGIRFSMKKTALGVKGLNDVFHKTSVC
jgi:hypothetical protein